MGIQPELPRHHVSPVLLLLAGPAGSYSASHWQSVVVFGPGSPSRALLAGITMFLVTRGLFPPVLSIFCAEVPWRYTLKAA